MADDHRPQHFGTGRIVVAAVDRAVAQRWEQAKERADSVQGSPAERVAAIEASFRNELMTIGAASGGTAALPGVGTMAVLGLTATELAWTTTRITDMVLTVAAVHGHHGSGHAERKAWVLALLTFDDPADEFDRAITRLGGTVHASRTMSVEMLDRVNSHLGRVLIGRMGAKRSAMLLGKFLPFGVGAVVGSTANRYLVRTMIRRADTFFSQLDSRPVAASAITPPKDRSWWKGRVR